MNKIVQVIQKYYIFKTYNGDTHYFIENILCPIEIPLWRPGKKK